MSENGNKFTIRFIEKEEKPEFYKAMQEVHEKLEDKTLFYMKTTEQYDYLYNHGDFAAAYNEQGKIVGGFVFFYAISSGLDEYNFGKDIGLPEEDHKRVVIMDSVFVLPEYRGNRLQVKLLQYIESKIDKTKHNYFTATVSPENPASYRSFEKQGYKLAITTKKYGGLIRSIYVKKV